MEVDITKSRVQCHLPSFIQVFKIRALATTIGVTKPHMIDYTYSHPKLHTFSQR